MPPDGRKVKASLTLTVPALRSFFRALPFALTWNLTVAAFFVDFVWPLTVLLPALPDTVAPCLEAPPARPTPAVPDSLAAAPQDSLTTAPGDSLAAPAPQPEED